MSCFISTASRFRWPWQRTGFDAAARLDQHVGEEQVRVDLDRRDVRHVDRVLAPAEPLRRVLDDAVGVTATWVGNRWLPRLQRLARNTCVARHQPPLRRGPPAPATTTASADAASEEPHEGRTGVGHGIDPAERRYVRSHEPPTVKSYRPDGVHPAAVSRYDRRMPHRAPRIAQGAGSHRYLTGKPDPLLPAARQRGRARS